MGNLYLVALERGSGRANRKWCACMGRVEVQQVVEGEGVHKCIYRWDYCCVGWLSPLFEFMKLRHKLKERRQPSNTQQ